jgi:hypothetical protein
MRKPGSTRTCCSLSSAFLRRDAPPGELQWMPQLLLLWRQGSRMFTNAWLRIYMENCCHTAAYRLHCLVAEAQQNS